MFWINKDSSLENYEIFNHQYVSREAIVKAIPTVGETDIKVGDTVIVHHNVFRRWHNQHGIEKNSRAYIDEDHYLVQPDQIFLYKKKSVFDYHTKWQAVDGYCFVAPVKSTDELSTEKEKPLVIIAGCVAQAENSEMLKREPYIDFVIGPQSYHHSKT